MRLKTLLIPAVMCLALAGCKSAEERAEDAYQEGLQLVASGDDDRARVEFRNAIKLVEGHFGARLEMARLQLRAGNARQALRAYRYVVEQEPGNLEALETISNISFVAQNWEQFDRYAPRAVETAPDDPDVQVLDLAMRYRQATLERDNAARPGLLAEAQVLEPEAPENPVLRRLLIDGYINEGEFEAGLAEIEETIQSDPNNPIFYRLKIQVLARLGDVDGLRSELKRMVEVFPQDDGSKANYLRFLISRGELDNAETYLREEADAAHGSDDPTAYVALVRFLSVNRSNDAALQELETRIISSPENMSLRALRATLRYDTGAREEAIAEMEGLVTEAAAAEAEETERQSRRTINQALRYKVALATMLASDGNEVGARRLVEEILEEEASNVEALKMQAAWQIEEDQTEAAVSGLRTALAESPNDAEAMTLMAQAYERSGNPDLMLNFLSLAAEAAGEAPGESLRYANALMAQNRVDQAQSTLVSSLRLNPNNPQILARLGDIYLQEGDLSRAQQVADALKARPEEVSQQAGAAMELDIIARDAGTDQAMAYLSELANSNTDNANIRVAYVQGLMETGQDAEALAYVEEILAEDPGNDRFRYLKSLTEAKLGDFDAAVATLKNLLENSPDAVLGWLQLARLQAVLEGPEEVTKTLDAGLEAAPGSGDLLWAKASHLEQQGNTDGAIQIYEDLYAVNSGSVVIANNLASMLTTYRTDEESLERARRIARRLVDSDIPALQDTYGWILFRSGDAEGALTYLEKAASGLPRDPNVQLHLGFAYDALERTEEARQQLQRAREAAGPVPSATLNARIAELETALSTP